MLLLLVIPVLLSAQEDPGTVDGDFSDGFGSFDDSFAEIGSSPDSSDEGQQDKNNLEVNGTAHTKIRYFMEQAVEDQDVLTTALNDFTGASLSVSYNADISDLYLKLKADPDLLSTNNFAFLNEAFIKLYLKGFNLQVGLVKETWGKCDNMHVLDLLNGTDYSDFINSKSMESKKAALMVKGDIMIGMNGLLEIVYEPFRITDTIPYSGNWTPSEILSAINTAENLLYNGPNGDDGLYASSFAVIYGGMYTSVYNQVLAATGVPAMAQAAAADPSVQSAAAELASRQAAEQTSQMIDSLLNSEYKPDISDSQFGLRYTDTFKGLDFGIQYYYGFEKKPRLPELDQISSLEELELAEFKYPRIHVIGADTAFALGSLNFRLEAAFTLMENRDYIDSIGYSAGLDFTIPVSNLDFNIQSSGLYYLEDCENRFQNKIAVRIKDSWANEKIKPEITAVYNFEDQDLLIKPQIDFSIDDQFEIAVSYTIFEGDIETTFGQFNKSDFAEVSFSYNF